MLASRPLTAGVGRNRLPFHERQFQTRSCAAKKAWLTCHSPKYQTDRSERASKEALHAWCRHAGWRVLFFEGATGAPRTGIVDAVIVRIRPGEPDDIDIRLVQLKAGASGLTASEITRMKRAVEGLSRDWLLAAFDGQTLHLLPDVPDAKRTANHALHRTAARASASDAPGISDAGFAASARFRRRSVS